MNQVPPTQLNQQHFQQQQSSQSSQHHQQQPASALPPLILNSRLHELIVAGTGSNERLEPALEHGLNKIAEEFLDEILSAAADLAFHRNSSTVDAKDCLLILERNYDLSVAGFIEPDNLPKVTESRYRQSMQGTESHQSRKNQVSRAMAGNSFASYSGSSNQK